MSDAQVIPKTHHSSRYFAVAHFFNLKISVHLLRNLLIFSKFIFNLLSSTTRYLKKLGTLYCIVLK